MVATARLWEPKAKSTPTGAQLTMFKRTHLSIDAIKEGEWLKTNVGLGTDKNEYWFNGSGSITIDRDGNRSAFYEEAMKGHDHNALKICAARSEFEWYSEKMPNDYSW